MYIGHLALPPAKVSSNMTVSPFQVEKSGLISCSPPFHAAPVKMPTVVSCHVFFLASLDVKSRMMMKAIWIECMTFGRRLHYFFKKYKNHDLFI